MKRLVLSIWMCVFFQPAASQELYLATKNEQIFPREVMQNGFGIKKNTANLMQVWQSHGHMNFNKSYINQPICINGKVYEHGIGIHADSDILVQLPKPADRFYAEVGYDDNAQTRGRAVNKVIFSVEATGKILWQSAPLSTTDQAVKIDLALENCTEFHLIVRSTGVDANLCHADWGNARVYYKNGEQVWLEQYASRTGIINKLPFSFVLDGSSSRDLLRQWRFTHTDSSLIDRTVHRLEWSKPDGSFQVHCRVLEFLNHPAIEWRVYFKNSGKLNSPVLEKVQALDVDIDEAPRLRLNQSRYQPVIIHCNKGSNNASTDFMPEQHILDIEQSWHIKSHAGRSSEAYLPFWNLEFHGSGLVAALGWSGDWQADFSYPQANQAVMQAGMSKLKLYLKPGEEISSPSVCLLYWEGSEALRGNNLFRRFMRNCIAPKWNGKEPIVLAMSGGSSALETVNEKNQIDYIHKITGTGAEVYWLDAGWYSGPQGAEWGQGRGNWFPDVKKFPNGMKAIADSAHRNGLKFLLWFDPEVVMPGTDIAVKHPEWLIERPGRDSRLYNLGNEQALKYMTDLISTNVQKWDVDIFRCDYNIDPGICWKLLDEPGRTGITELRYVEGLYRFWDELLKRKQGLLIDNCASGGRRIDYETCKRSVPLWRSDYECAVYSDSYEAGQNQTFGLSYYLPFHSTGFGPSFDKYKDRSFTTSSVVFSIGAPNAETLSDVPFDKVKKLWDDVKSYNYLMLGDYYPLTEFSLTDESWMALQYDCPELGEGCLLCFCRPRAPFTEAEFSLRAIDVQAMYKLLYLDSGLERVVKGEELHRLKVKLQRSESAVIKYVMLKD
jgi:alpha-galactosidase